MPPTSTVEPPATERTLHTTEFLEQILLNLDNQSLLSQRVNHTFKSTITGSLKLQKKLFFRLADEDEDEGVKYGDEGMNPLATKVPNLTLDPTARMTWTFPSTFNNNNRRRHRRPTPTPPTRTLTRNRPRSSHTPVLVLPITPSWRRMYLAHSHPPSNEPHTEIPMQRQVKRTKRSKPIAHTVTTLRVPTTPPLALGEYERRAAERFREVEEMMEEMRRWRD